MKKWLINTEKNGMKYVLVEHCTVSYADAKTTIEDIIVPVWEPRQQWLTPHPSL